MHSAVLTDFLVVDQDRAGGGVRQQLGEQPRITRQMKSSDGGAADNPERYEFDCNLAVPLPMCMAPLRKGQDRREEMETGVSSRSTPSGCAPSPRSSASGNEKKAGLVDVISERKKKSAPPRGWSEASPLGGPST